MKKKIFSGVATALVTPFNSNNEIDFSVLKDLIDFQISNDVSAIVLAGTTGEAPTLSFEEYSALIAYGNEYINHRIPLIAGSGSNNTNTAIKYSLEAQKRGADALLIVTPYYNKPTQQGIIDYYTEIASFVKLPIIAYNVPGRTGSDILPNTYQKLYDIREIQGVKDASNRIDDYVEKFSNPDISIYCGNDTLFLPYISLGADGIISVISNLYPKEMSQIYRYFTSGNPQIALRIYKTIAPMIHAISLETNPIPIKKSLSIAGFNAGSPRPPLTPCTSDTEKLLLQLIPNTPSLSTQK